MGKISRRANSEKLSRKEKQELRKENEKLQEQVKTVSSKSSGSFILVKLQLIHVNFPFRSYYQLLL